MRRRLADAEKQECKMNRFPAILLFAILPATCPQAGSLGRLFFTPEQRAQLDREYAQRATAENKHATVLMLNGIVQRSDGARTVWINGMAQDAGGKSKQVPDSHIIVTPEQPQPIEIKVGQRLLLEQAAER